MLLLLVGCSIHFNWAVVVVAVVVAVVAVVGGVGCSIHFNSLKDPLWSLLVVGCWCCCW